MAHGSLKRSPLAPKEQPKLPSVVGVRLGTAASGVRYEGRDDLLVVSFPEGAFAAGVYTTNQVTGAPVDWCRGITPSDEIFGLVVNAGNANACTGTQGVVDTREMAQAVARQVGASCHEHAVLVASTGVIGEPLPMDRVFRGIEVAASKLGQADFWDASRAIMTTDTFAKAASAQVTLHGKTYTICGITKGSGMIAPNMATMLGFVFTDAPIASAALSPILKRATDRTFNRITVDSDMSTSDTLLLFATGKDNPVDDASASELAPFEQGLEAVLKDLAQQVVRDGEGATKIATIAITGARSDEDAKTIGLTVANSPLVKTAISGSDANWGRLFMAVGKSPVTIDKHALGLRVGGVEVAREGKRVEGYDEAPVSAHMRGDEVHIAISVGKGPGSAELWTCDFSDGYIRINADYRS